MNSKRNPYVGPRTFKETDKDYFKGRDKESRDLLAFVSAEPLVLFYAQSGAGKSSLINTKLIPGLRQKGFDILPVARVTGDLPRGIVDVRNIFVFNLLSSLNQEIDPQQITQTHLTDYLQQIKNNSSKKYRILIIDQFEEILTNHLGRWEEREDFFWQLQATIQNDPFLWVLLSMREDHIAGLKPYEEILPDGLHKRFQMHRLKKEAAIKAIKEPARLAGRPFAKNVAEELVENLSQIRESNIASAQYQTGEYIEPVQLQVVCFQLWEKLRFRDAPTITMQHMQELGNIDRALADFYNQAIATVVRKEKISEIDLRGWFNKKLITESQTRGIVYQGSTKTEGMPNDAVNLLAAQYLLRADRRAGGIWFEIVHDRFVDPIVQANANWLENKGLLYQAAIAWDESGRSASKLFLGDQLKDTLEKVNWRNTEPLILAFLRECGRANQEMDRLEVQRKQELQQAQQLAHEQQKRAEAEVQNVKRFRKFFVGATILALLCFFLLLFAVKSRNDAIASERTTQMQATAMFNQNQSIASQATQNARLATSDAQFATSEAIARATASQSEALNFELGGTATKRAVIVNEKVFLNIPYFQQDAFYAQNVDRDSGLTALAMILNAAPINSTLKTDDLYSRYLQQKNYRTSLVEPKEIESVSNQFNPNLQMKYHSEWFQSSNPFEQLKNALRLNKPVIVLVDHANLRSAGSNYRYRVFNEDGSTSDHTTSYLLITGFDFEHIYGHDPAPNGLGCNFKLTNEQFIRTWSLTSEKNVQYNYQNTGIFPENVSFENIANQMDTIPPDC